MDESKRPGTEPSPGDGAMPALRGRRAQLLEGLIKSSEGAVVHGLWGAGRTTVLRLLDETFRTWGDAVLWIRRGEEPLEPLHRLWPELPARPESLDEALRGGGPPAAAELLRSLLADRGGPLILLADDVDRLDATSREVLESLSRLVEPAGVRWFLALEPPLEKAGRGPRAGPPRSALLPAMDDAEVKDLAAGLPEERARWVVGAAEGHPVHARLYVEWARRAPEEAPPPDTPSRAAALLQEALPPEARRLGSALGLLERLPFALAGQVAGVADPRRALGELQALGLARAEQGWLRPTGPAAARAMAGRLEEEEREALRARVVHLAREGSLAPALRLRLLEAAGEPAASLRLDLAAEAARRGALATARSLYRPDPAAPLSLRLLLEPTARLSREPGLPRAEALRREAREHREEGREEEARQAARQALEEAGAPTDPGRAGARTGETAGLVAALYAFLATGAPEPEGYLRAAARTVSGREAAPHLLALAARLPDPRAAAETAREALQAGREDPYLELAALEALGRIEGQPELWERGATLARRLGRAGPEADFLERLAAAPLARGAWQEAVPWLERLVRLPHDPELRPRLAAAMERLGGAFVALRRFDEVERAYRDCLALSRALGDGPRAARVGVELGRLALFRGDREAAERQFHEALRLAQAPAARALAVVGLAEAALVGSNPREAQRLAEEARGLHAGDPWVEVATGRLMAEAAMQALDVPRAAELTQATLPLAQQHGFTDEADRLERLLADLRSREGRFLVLRPRELRGTALPVPTRVTRLGRSGDCDLVLPDSSVSRVHAAVEWSQGMPYLVPLAPGNLTELNSRPVTLPTALAHGDRVRLGDLVLQWEFPAPSS